MVGRFPQVGGRPRGSGPTGAASWIASFLAAAGCGDEAYPTPYATDRAVYSEFLSGDDVRAELPRLREQRVGLDLAMPADEVGGDDLKATILAARREGVPVRAWLLLPDADGYWPGEDNLPAYAALVDRFRAWNEAEDLGVEWIVVDMEPPLSTSNELAAALEAGMLTSVIPLLEANKDPQEHAAAREAWTSAIEDWQSSGLGVAVVALPFVLDDFGDGDSDVQDMFESPVDGLPWDEVGFLVYQNLYVAADGGRYGPALVYDYATTVRERYGERGVVALGSIGDIGKNTTSVGYAEPAQLRADLAALSAAGVAQARLFSLDGIVAEGGVEAWLTGLAPGPQTPPDDAVQAAQQARRLVSVLDTL